MPQSLDQWRADTPGCAHRNHLNNAGAALMPRPVIDAIKAHIDLEAEIGGYEAADARAAEIESGYADLARLVGAAERNIAVVANATAGFVQAISSFDFDYGDVIVTSRCDYTSNQIQYLALNKRLGVEIVYAADLPDGGVDPDAVRDAIRHAGASCKLVAVSWMPTNSGLVQDVTAVGRVCGDMGVSYLVDACQAVGQIPIDVAAIGCDYLTATARKFLRGPRGVGFMFASDAALARGDHPLFVDMRGARWTAPGEYDVEPTARRFEDWEFPYALVLAQSAAARYAAGVGIDVAQQRAWSLATRLRAALASIDGVHVLDRGSVKSAIVTASVDGLDARTVVSFLAERNINSVVSLREYAHYDFGDKHVETAIRLSPHYYNTEEEVDEGASAVRDFVSGERPTLTHV